MERHVFLSCYFISILLIYNDVKPRETETPQCISLTLSGQTAPVAKLCWQRRDCCCQKRILYVHWFWMNDAKGNFVSYFKRGKKKTTFANIVVSDVNWLQSSQQ